MRADDFAAKIEALKAAGSEAVALMQQYGAQGGPNVAVLQQQVDWFRVNTPQMIASARQWDAAVPPVVTPPPTTKAPGMYYSVNGNERNVELVFPVKEADGRIEPAKFGGHLRLTDVVNLSFVSPVGSGGLVGFLHSSGYPQSQRTFTIWINDVQVQKFDSDALNTRLGVHTKAGDRVKLRMETKPGVAAQFVDMDIVCQDPA